MSNNATKNKVKDPTGVDTSNLAAKKDFIDLNAEVDKLDIAKLLNIPSDFENLKKKVDDIDADTMKTIPINLL